MVFVCRKPKADPSALTRPWGSAFMSILRSSVILSFLALLSFGCQNPGSSDEWSSGGSSPSELKRSAMVETLFNDYMDQRFGMWEKQVAPDAVATWNTTVMTGSELVAAMSSGHERFHDIRVDNVMITTVDRSADQADSFVSLDWSGTIPSNGRRVDIPCQFRIKWQGMQIIGYHEVFNEAIVMAAKEADPK